MEEKNELNDIILNKGDSTNGKKKILLAVATLGVVLIIVIVLMSKLTPDAQTNLPQPNPLPQQKADTQPTFDEEPLFEEIDVIEEDSQDSDNLDEIAQRLKQESLEKTEPKPKPKKQKIIQKPKPKPKPKKHIYKKPAPKKKVIHKKTTASNVGRYYIQVGSFSIYKPNKKFLNSITMRGYNYKFHKVGELNKVLVGPFKTETEARSALRVVKSKIEHGAFLTKI
ncbi:MAG: SPOR domain-containing protein [Epsilonproteobacteria bacterium]|nr:SPOR domain-containing protein [Campylobacterota bacterium]